MTTLVSAITTTVGNILADTALVRWTQAQITDYINAAQREIAIAQPESTAVIANLTLVAGTKQVLPAGAIKLGKLTRNMGVGGATPADAPRLVTQELMDHFRPTWHQDTATLVVANYMKDERHPRTFYVYPPMSGATTVEAEYSVLPAVVAAPSDALTVPDFYVSAVVDYVCWRCFSADIEIPGIASKALAHRAAFDAALGVIDTGEGDQK